MGVRPERPGRHALQVVFLEGHLPEERVKVVGLECLDGLAQRKELARG